MKRTRVLQLITGFATGEQVGGAELFGIQLARHLDRESFDRAVFGLWQYGSKREEEWLTTLRKEGVRAGILTVPTGHLIADLQRAFSNLWSVVSNFRPHIINSHSERTDAFGMFCRALHPVHPRCVRTMHTDEQWQDRPCLGKILINGVFPLFFETEVAISKAVRQRLDNRHLAVLMRKKSVLCYNGIEAAILKRRGSSERNNLPDIHSQAPALGIVGRLTEQKGHPDLLKAIASVLQRRVVHLLIIGSGPREAELRRLVSELGIDEFVHFLGSRNDVLDILPQIDLLVSSSLWEGFPTVLLEAMALRVPVIATDVSGSRELVRPGKTGFLVPPSDPDHLAEAILFMLNRPAEARKMAENARERVTQFTIQNAAARYEQIYGQTRVVQNKPRTLRCL